VACTELARQGLLAPGAHFTPALARTQLYEAAGGGLLFLLLIILRGRRQCFAGSLALIYAMGYALLRATVEILRGDMARGFLFEFHSPRLASWLGLPLNQPLALSTAQTFSLALGAAAAVAYGILRRHKTG
jgi:prolipoprotein diacylglyceryltransferase